MTHSISLPSGKKLRGTRFDVREMESIAYLFRFARKPEDKRGLYRLTFANGEQYAGQSVNVPVRYASHRRRWHDIVALEFFCIPTGDLNEPERQLISLTEASSSVRNLKDTNRPGGRGDLELDINEGDSINLTWERSRRTKPGQGVTDRSRQKFFDLASSERYPYLRDALGWYISETIADPFNTQRHLWVITARPSTNAAYGYGRETAFSVGVLETFVIHRAGPEDPDQLIAFINTTAVDMVSMEDPDGQWMLETHAGYNYDVVSTWTFTFEYLLDVIYGDAEFPHLDLMLEKAYELNIRLMRQNGVGMFRKYHNEHLAQDVLNASVFWAAQSPDIKTFASAADAEPYKLSAEN